MFHNITPTGDKFIELYRVAIFQLWMLNDAFKVLGFCFGGGCDGDGGGEREGQSFFGVGDRLPRTRS